MLEKDPVLTQKTGEYLATHVTASDIQQSGLEEAVLKHGLQFGMTTPSLQNDKRASKVLEITKTSQNYARQ